MIDIEMRLRPALMITAVILAGCAGAPPQAFHDIAQHPIELRESSVHVALAGLSAPEAQAVGLQVADSRPNDGSRFTVVADAVTARAVRDGLNTAGIAAQDIRVVDAARGMEIVRIDVVATASGCDPASVSISGFGRIDDGFGHDNANSDLFGCAVQRNIAAMAADPRRLVVPAPFSGRDGVRAADVYGKWSRGQPTASSSVLPSEKAASNAGGGN